LAGNDNVFYNEAIKINSNNKHALFEKGLLHADLAQYENTLKCFKKIITLEPENSMAWNNKGYTLEKLNFLEEAINCYKKALNINSNNSNSRKNLNKLRLK
jgi:tetratricopeptide (TPR) repeat protein